jgi:hypothetical protein
MDARGRYDESDLGERAGRVLTDDRGLEGRGLRLRESASGGSHVGPSSVGMEKSADRIADGGRPQGRLTRLHRPQAGTGSSSAGASETPMTFSRRVSAWKAKPWTSSDDTPRIS